MSADTRTSLYTCTSLSPNSSKLFVANSLIFSHLSIFVLSNKPKSHSKTKTPHFSSIFSLLNNTTMAIPTFKFGFMMMIISAMLLSIANSDDSPFIVAHKKATITKLGNGVERVSVSIDIYNQGSMTVYDVSLVDDSWPTESFDVISGNFSRTWDSLDGGAIVSHSIELEPRVKGLFQGSPALVTFRIPTKAAPVVAYTTPIIPLDLLGDAKVEDNLDLAKRLLAKFGPQFSAVSLVALFGYLIATPSKSNGAKANKKRR